MFQNLLQAHVIDSNNYVAFTFFVGTMAMMAAAVFFFFELNNVEKKMENFYSSFRSHYFYCSRALLLHAGLQFGNRGISNFLPLC